MRTGLQSVNHSFSSGAEDENPMGDVNKINEYNKRTEMLIKKHF